MIPLRPTVLFAFLCLALLPLRAQQELSADEFRRDFNQGLNLGDDKLQDKAIRKRMSHALRYLEDLWSARLKGERDGDTKIDALMASWGRCFGDQVAMEKVQRWADSVGNEEWKTLHSVRQQSLQVWNEYNDVISKALVKADYQRAAEAFATLAKSAEAIGHYMEASDNWSLASVVASKMPDRTIEDREYVVFLIEQNLAARDNLGFTFDRHYITGKEFVKAERVQIEEAKKNADKRAKEGYDAGAKGIEALVMPNVPAAVHELTYEVVKDWQKDLGYGPRSGPLPVFWWIVSMTEVGNARKFDWFRRQELNLHRLGASKFGLSTSATDASQAIEIDASARPKPTEFWLDADKKQPYAMFFWQGGERETTGVAECNYSPSPKVANVYYQSAASWHATVDKETFTFYDDDASGMPGRTDPFEGDFKLHMLGDALGAGVPAPLFDSMRIGKGPRVPFSSFVKLPTGWFHLELKAADSMSLRPLNPEYVKTGKLRLEWDGPKPTMPRQLVVRGKGDYQGAIFDLTTQKEVEVPAGEYEVLFGRILAGKGARAQSACIYPGEGSKTIVVEAGNTKAVEMGAPFRLEFRRTGDKSASIDALSIHVTDRSGAIITELQSLGLHCDVVAAKDESGKGKKVVGEFLPMTDGNLVAQASLHYSNLGFQAGCFPMPKGYQKGEMVLSVQLPADGMKLGLEVKKPPLFGKLETVWH